MTMKLTLTDILPSSGTCVVLATSKLRLGRMAGGLVKPAGSALTKTLKAAGFKGELHEAVDLIAPHKLSMDRLIVIGVGETSPAEPLDWQKLGGTIAGVLQGKSISAATIVIERQTAARLQAHDVAACAHGMVLRGYRFDKYLTDDRKAAGRDLNLRLCCADPAPARRAFKAARAVADGTMLARDLVNEPANVLGPVEFARRIGALRRKGGLAVEILTRKRLEQLGMRALLAVAQGSARQARVAVMRWQGGKRAAAPVVLIGKGVCFDTGGISIKPSQGMEDMKGDMGGAAAVVGTMYALAARKANVNAVGIVGLVENMPGSNAQRPGDIVTSMSGQTIEVLNTDAEGRLVLADLLTYAQKRFKPAAMVDLATLTGACMVALGQHHAGLFANDDDMAKALFAAGQKSGEKVWHLPLGEEYDKMIKSKTADMQNIGGRWAGAITAAQFLRRFVDDKAKWAHLDIAGTAMGSPRTAINRSWASGFGVQLLDQWVRDVHEG